MLCCFNILVEKMVNVFNTCDFFVFQMSLLCVFFKEPVLFSGTMRRNMDPFNEHNDLALWNILDEVSCNTR